MIGRIEENHVVVGANKTLEKREFGIKRGDKIYLHPIEAVYLFSRNLLRINGVENVLLWAKEVVENFSTYYFVYEDLRNRGYKVRPVGDLLLARKAFFPISERRPITIPELADKAKSYEDFILAVLDEESEITYYRVYEKDLRGRQVEEIRKITGYILEDRVITENKEIFERFFYGSEKENFVALSLVESVYLVEKNLMDVFDANMKKLRLEELLKIAKNVEKEFERKYEVYRDLKERGFVVKTGFKFGSDFRVYSEVESVKDLPHSEYLVSIVDNKMLRASEIARAVRLAHSVRKKMIFAFDRRYLCIEWVRV